MRKDLLSLRFLKLIKMFYFIVFFVVVRGMKIEIANE